MNTYTIPVLFTVNNKTEKEAIKTLQVFLQKITPLKHLVNQYFLIFAQFDDTILNAV